MKFITMYFHKIPLKRENSMFQVQNASATSERHIVVAATKPRNFTV